MFKPTYVFERVFKITPDFLKSKGIKGLFLDLDNTLTTHNNGEIPQSSIDWIKKMKDSGIKLILVSNNSYERVKPVADMLGLDFEPKGRKPLPVGYIRAKKRMGLKRKEVAAVGDQIFTDILGGFLMGTRSIFVFPIELETSFWFTVKRKIEKFFLPKKFTET